MVQDERSAKLFPVEVYTRHSATAAPVNGFHFLTVCHFFVCAHELGKFFFARLVVLIARLPLGHLLRIPGLESHIELIKGAFGRQLVLNAVH